MLIHNIFLRNCEKEPHVKGIKYLTPQFVKNEILLDLVIVNVKIFEVVILRLVKEYKK